MSALTSAIANAEKALALDPPDPNFTVIAQPVFLRLPALASVPGLTQAEVDSFNALRTNGENFVAISGALLTSFNRAVGAYDANNDFWEAKQREAAAQYSLQLSILTREQITLLANWQAALKNGTLGTITVTPNDVYNFEVNLISSGLPPAYVQALTQLGADAATIEEIKSRLGVQDIYAVAGAFPDTLTNATLASTLDQEALALYAAALNNATPLAEGQKIEGEGSITIPAGRVTFGIEAKIEDTGNLESEIELKVSSTSTNFRFIHSVVTRAALLGNTAVLEGTYQLSDGTTGTFQIVVADNARHGKGADTFTVTLSNEYRASGTLTNGNIKIKSEKSDDGHGHD